MLRKFWIRQKNGFLLKKRVIHLGHNEIPLSQLILLRLCLCQIQLQHLARTCRSSGSAAGSHVGVSGRAKATLI